MDNDDLYKKDWPGSEDKGDGGACVPRKPRPKNGGPGVARVVKEEELVGV